MEGHNSSDQLDNVNRIPIPEQLRYREEVRLSKISTDKNKNEMDKEKKEFEKEFRRLLSEIKLKVVNTDEIASDRSKLSRSFEEIRNDLQNLHKMVAGASSFSTTYEKRVANETLSSLLEVISSKESELLPKKKFAFASRKKESDKQIKPNVSVVQSPVNRMLSEALSMSISLSDADGQSLEKLPDDVNGKDVEISRLSNCTVRIYGFPSTVHMTSLKNCHIFLGPVSTSVFVEECESSTLTLACQQLRVHSSRDLTFLVHITSRSIIEECHGIRFGRYDWKYDHLTEHFAASGLNQNINNWTLVDDFNWLSADVASPNWSLLRVDEDIK